MVTAAAGLAGWGRPGAPAGAGLPAMGPVAEQGHAADLAKIWRKLQTAKNYVALAVAIVCFCFDEEDKQVNIFRFSTDSNQPKCAEITQVVDGGQRLQMYTKEIPTKYDGSKNCVKLVAVVCCSMVCTTICTC